MHREVQSSAHYWPGLVRPFAEDTCLPFLHATQNRDGGWGYTPGAVSSVEPTCWALLALERHERTQHLCERGAAWLERVQLRNGAWPGQPGSSQGCWVTALAGLALHAQQRSPKAGARSARWLCRSLPADANFLSRIGLRLAVSAAAPFGWGCTRASVTSIEPTAAALLFLQSLPPDQRPRRAARRMKYACAALRGYLQRATGAADASASAGAYAAAWALLALRNECDYPEMQEHLNWIQQAGYASRGPASLAMAHIALRACGRRSDSLEARLARFHNSNQFLNQVPVVAAASLALNPLPVWLARKSSSVIARGPMLLQRV